ncbi:hypothetical protein L1887_07476 [Cichorium endivia]|nr:hypothetical protein L1887_07476 [Cichorium endivia]
MGIYFIIIESNLVKTALKTQSLKWASGKTVNISENDKENHWVSVHGLNSPPPIISYRTQTQTHTLVSFSAFSPSSLVFINPKSI